MYSFLRNHDLASYPPALRSAFAIRLWVNPSLVLLASKDKVEKVRLWIRLLVVKYIYEYVSDEYEEEHMQVPCV